MTDDEAEMEWWNSLSDEDRKVWMARAGNTGRAKDAWESYKHRPVNSASPAANT